VDTKPPGLVLKVEIWLPRPGGLRRVFSSFAACGNKVDPVYEALRFGTSLAQRTKKGGSGSGSDSPPRTSVIDLIFSSLKGLGGAE
jgi:hypothetical protein